MIVLIPISLHSARVVVLTLATTIPIGAVGGLAAQNPPTVEPASAVWNTPHVLELIGRATSQRQSTAISEDLKTYRADARGYVYFFVDRPNEEEPVLVKADQVAIDVMWRAPNSTRQTIVGLRDEELLPTNIRYHLDHLTVVQDDFGDFIRLGDGDEVEAVLHPVAPSARDAYDFQLADSVSLMHSDGTTEVRVYEVLVRPRNFDSPGFVGAIYLDRDRAAIVRMNFSFTPASYVDDYLDYIRISLDNSLWMGAHWLPYRQEMEIRREIPYFDFQAGSIIRGRFEIGPYDFNETLSPSLFAGPTVQSVSPAQQWDFAFERGLFDDLAETGGLGPSPKLEGVQDQVSAVVESEVMSGLAPVRFHASQISDFARYNRAEGVFVGGGITLRAAGDFTIRGTGGYAFGRSLASGTLTLNGSQTGVSPVVAAYWDVMGDIGGHPGSTRLENTISSAAGARDYLDPYFRRGATVMLSLRPDAALSVATRFEDHRSARDVVADSPDTGFRPVRSIDEGTMVSVSVQAKTEVRPGATVRTMVTGGRLADSNFAVITADADWQLEDAERRWSLLTSVSAGLQNADAPAQSLFLLGGRHTIMGHGYRLFVGQAYWLARVEGTIPIRAPWLGVRAFTALGSTYLGGATPPVAWQARDSNGLRGSVGLGLSIGWDTVRLDVGRAVWGTGWEAMLSVAPELRSWM